MLLNLLVLLLPENLPPNLDSSRACGSGLSAYLHPVVPAVGNHPVSHAVHRHTCWFIHLPGTLASPPQRLQQLPPQAGQVQTAPA